MADTISALDTATTDELIAALVARHRSNLAQTCGQLTDIELFLTTLLSLNKNFADKVSRAINAGGTEFSHEHPIWKDTPPEKTAEILLSLLKIPSKPNSPNPWPSRNPFDS